MEDGQHAFIRHRALNDRAGCIRKHGGKFYVAVLIVGDESSAQWFEVPSLDAGQIVLTTSLENIAAETYGNAGVNLPPIHADPQPQPRPQPQPQPSRVATAFAGYREYRKEVKRNDALNKRAMLFPCPSCVAGKDQQCVSPAGNRLPELHISRIEQVQRHWQHL